MAKITKAEKELEDYKYWEQIELVFWRRYKVRKIPWDERCFRGNNGKTHRNENI